MSEREQFNHSLLVGLHEKPVVNLISILGMTWQQRQSTGRLIYSPFREAMLRRGRCAFREGNACFGAPDQQLHILQRTCLASDACQAALEILYCPKNSRAF